MDGIYMAGTRTTHVAHYFLISPTLSANTGFADTVAVVDTRQ